MNAEKYLEEAALWIRDNRERFWSVVGSVFLIGLLVALVIQKKEKETIEAWTQLGTVQSYMAQANYPEAAKSLENWESKFGHTSAATYAKFIKADLAYQTTHYAQAAQIYAEMSQSAKPEINKPLALYAQVTSAEAAGEYPAAQSSAQAFLDKYPDHYLAASMYITQARLAELTNNPTAAIAVYDRFTLLFPQSPWVTLAKARSQTLSKK